MVTLTGKRISDVWYTSNMDPNKESAVQFLQMIVAGDIDAAYDKYIDMKGRHHNVFTPVGMPALRQGMKDAHTKFPNKQFVIQHVLGDEDLVAVHSHMTLEPGKL